MRLHDAFSLGALCTLAAATWVGAGCQSGEVSNSPGAPLDSPRMAQGSESVSKVEAPTPTICSTPDLRRAPSPPLVAGFEPTMVDVSALTAVTTFDVQTQDAWVTARLQFQVGPKGGHPIFDLRQTIESAQLDGKVIDPSQMPQVDVGGGEGAEVRVLNEWLNPCTVHTLRLDYRLTTPQAKGAFAIDWGLDADDNKAVHWDFGFSDGIAGRFLESWFPSNLTYDETPIELHLALRGGTGNYVLATNGDVAPTTPSGGESHRWMLTFPETFTALSPMLVLTPANQVEVAELSIDLGRPIRLSVFKHVDARKTAVNLAYSIKKRLEKYGGLGEYTHGDRFVTYIWPKHTGLSGMEYNGGTTSLDYALGHEVCHSWFGRSAKPVGENDGWIDEGWTTYFNDAGGDYGRPLNPEDGPWTLDIGHPWLRRTVSESYGNGSKVFAGLADLLGIEELRRLMYVFYDEHKDGFVRTSDLERTLYCATAAVEKKSAIQQIFHRYVYGREGQVSTSVDCAAE